MGFAGLDELGAGLERGWDQVVRGPAVDPPGLPSLAFVVETDGVRDPTVFDEPCKVARVFLKVKLWAVEPNDPKPVLVVLLGPLDQHRHSPEAVGA